MSRPLHHITPYVAALLLLLSLFMSACSGQISEPTPTDVPVVVNDVAIYETDSTEWRICIVAEHLTYAEAVAVELPPPFLLPTREQAATLRLLTYPSAERFVTSDGYTFGMPSASVSKAGSKTQYSVLGLFIRPTVIRIDF